MAVGASRVYPGDRWVTDVLGSWTLGLLWLTVVATAGHLLTGAHTRDAGTSVQTVAP